MALTIVARIVARPGQEATVRAALEALVPITREEPGCLRYDLHVDRTAPGSFLFYET